MKRQPNHLEKDLVHAAFDYYARTPWNEIPWDALFLVRVPTEDLPLVAAVMGGAGEEYGLLLARGENAMKLLTDLVLDTPEEEDLSQVGDLLSISFEAWGSVSDDFRRLVERAGQKPRREKMVPVIFLSPPHREPHPPGRGDMRTLLLVLRGVNAALDDGSLRPSTLDLQGRRILEIEIEKNGKQVSHTTREVDWPESSIDMPPLLMLPMDLEHLPHLQERWLLANLPLPGRIDDDDRLAYALLLGVEDGPIRNLCIARGAYLSESAELLAEAMRGRGTLESEAGLPSAILFNDRRLHEALAPALAALDISTELNPKSEALQAMLDGLADLLPEAEFEPEPGSLESWKALEYEAGKCLAIEIEEKDLITPRVLKRYFGKADYGQEVLQKYPHFSPHAALIEWFAADYRATKRSKTLIEKFLAKKGELDPRIRTLLEARQEARASVYRVESCEPGLSLEVEDIFDGEHFTVYDKALSGCNIEGTFMPLRLIFVGGWTFPLFAGPPLTSMQIVAALGAVTHPNANLTYRAFKQEPEIMGHLWSWLLHQRPPTLQNTDGDDLENQSASFLVTNVNRLLAHFEDHPDLDFDESEGTWVWGREGGPGGLGARTVLGRLTLLDDRLLLEVNSVPRLERARAWLEATGDVSFESVTASAFASKERPLDDRLPSPPPEAPSPEVIEALKTMMFEHYQRWMDEPVPMLGNLTPRQACKNPEGAHRVGQLVRTMPAIQTPGGPIEVPRSMILAELGISAPGA